MNDKIQKHIARSFAEESRASSRSEAFALLAEKEGRGGLARLLRALARAQGVRARRFGHLMRGKIEGTKENLQEVEANAAQRVEAYGGMIQDVKAVPTGGAVRKGFIQSRRTTAETRELLEGVLEGRDPQEGTEYFVCRICGHIHVGEVPENCPVCGAVPGRFQEVE